MGRTFRCELLSDSAAKAVLVLCLLFLLSPVTGWAACRTHTLHWYNSQCHSSYSYEIGDSPRPYNQSCVTHFRVNSNCDKDVTITFVSDVPVICGSSTSSIWDIYYTYQTCSTQAEADSLKCELNPGDPSCGPAKDTTTMNNLVKHCENDLEGESHFRYNDQGNVVGYCDMCDKSGDENNIYHGYTNPYMQGAIEAKREQCCNGQGQIGDDFSCLASDNGCYGANCDWSGSNGGASSLKSNCDLSKPVALGLTCEEYGMGVDQSQEGAGGSSSDTTGTGSSDSGDAPGDSTGADFEYDYNDSLHKIIDSLGKIISISQLMLEKLGTGGDTIIVNTERDSVINNVNVEVSAPNVYFNDSVYKTQLGNLENIQGRIRQLLIPGDTTQQYASLYDTIASSFNKIQRTLDTGILYGFRLDSVLFTEGLIDTAHYGYADSVDKYIGSGRGYTDYVDSIGQAWGADTISAGFDSSYSYGFCAADDSVCIKGKGSGLGVGDFLGDDTSSLVRGMGGALDSNVMNEEDSLPSKWAALWDSTKKYAIFKDFEEKFYASLGAAVPDKNTCPEQCTRFEIESDLSWMKNIGIDFSLCAPITTLGNIDVLLFLRLLLRILTIITCLSITMWEVTSSRSKIGF